MFNYLSVVYNEFAGSATITFDVETAGFFIAVAFMSQLLARIMMSICDDFRDIIKNHFLKSKVGDTKNVDK